MENDRDWSRLPLEALEIIMKKLLLFTADLFRFCSVCSSWCTAASNLADLLPSELTPRIMLPYPLSPSDHNNVQFFSLPTSSSSSSPYRRLHLPELRDKMCYGLNHGNWLLVISNTGVNSSPLLFNPFTRSQIPLPPLPLPTPWKARIHGLYDDDDDDSCGDFFFTQPGFYMPSIFLAVLSSDPASSPNFEIMVTHGLDMRPAFCRPGDTEWTPVVEEGGSGEPCRMIEALAYCNGLPVLLLPPPLWYHHYPSGPKGSPGVIW